MLLLDHVILIFFSLKVQGGGVISYSSTLILSKLCVPIYNMANVIKNDKLRFIVNENLYPYFIIIYCLSVVTSYYFNAIVNISLCCPLSGE